LIINYFELDVDEDEDDSDEVDEPEEGFVETDLLDTTPADIYRAGRSKFPIAKEFGYSFVFFSKLFLRFILVKWIQLQWKNI
jgi:hypothetical protein